MSTVVVQVKWGKEKYDVEIDLEQNGLVFKTQLFSITGVSVEKQKVFGFKGGLLKDDADMSKLGIKKGQVITLMGTRDENIHKESDQKVVFLEDLGEDAVHSRGAPPGLENLGNTCYMNSTIQCLRAVKPLTQSLERFKGVINSAPGNESTNLSVSLKQLFSQLGNSHKPISPFVFLAYLRTAFPQFSQKRDGHFMQQDAEECWTLIVNSALNNSLTSLDLFGSLPKSNSIISSIFGGEFISQIKCLEAEEDGDAIIEPFFKLPCHIDNNTGFLTTGLKSALTEDLVKKSEKLGRDAKFQRTKKINKLPSHLMVQFVRFFWKTATSTRAKIMKPVEFPMRLDVFELCTIELQESLKPKRDIILKERLQTTGNKNKNNNSSSSSNSSAGGASTSSSELLASSSGADVEMTDANLKKEADDFINDSGFYDLKAVLTHRGREADSGHYVAWVRDEKDHEIWYKFDDEKVSIVKEEEIKALSGKGGGDWHIAYLCIYGPI